MGLQMLHAAAARDAKAIKAGMQNMEASDEQALDPEAAEITEPETAPIPEAVRANIPPRYRNAAERLAAIRQREKDREAERIELSKQSPMMQALIKVAEAYQCSEEEIEIMRQAADEDPDAAETFENLAREIGFSPATKSIGLSL